ncbi:MAG: hypothetical protein DDT26_02469 [Dehalococcoidia bacterium]|nr:hypothetical protein [Chloroflexota bacterium]MBT9165934.1 hypothetical protein [Chloroflexota bacterium]
MQAILDSPGRDRKDAAEFLEIIVTGSRIARKLSTLTASSATLSAQKLCPTKPT